jgi:hypothetical protein
MTRFYFFVLAVLSVWRITYLLNAEGGPGGVLVRLRSLLGNGILGRLADCFYCLSLWVAAPFAWLLASAWTERLMLWPALSGAAILLERATAPAMPGYVEDASPETTPEVPDELLRTIQTSGSDKD